MTEPLEPAAGGELPADVQAADAQASELMHQGMELMTDPRPEAPSEALACFDRALAIREALPLDTSPALRFGVAACWLNRADALMRLGGEAQIGEAVRSCDQGIQVLQTLPLEDDPRFPRRLALAHHNRGLFLQAQSRAIGESIEAMEQALSVLDAPHAAAIEDLPYLRSVICTNLAHALAAEGSLDAAVRACATAAQAVAIVSEAEGEAPGAAEIGLRARHALCRAFAQRLTAAQAAGTPLENDDVHDATDAVDEGLALVRRWEQRGVDAFRGTAVDLFRFGLQVYLVYQPQFLQEFLDENLDPAASSESYANDPDIRAAAQQIVELHAKLYA